MYLGARCRLNAVTSHFGRSGTSLKAQKKRLRAAQRDSSKASSLMSPLFQVCLKGEVS